MILPECLFCDKGVNYHYDTYKCNPCRATYYFERCGDIIYIIEIQILMDEQKFFIYDNTEQNVKLLSRNINDYSRSTIIYEENNVTLDDLPSKIDLAKRYFKDAFKLFV